MSRPTSGPMMSWTSPPEEKLPPFEPKTTTSMVVVVGEGAEPVAERGIALEGQRVLALGAVEGDAGDAAGGLEAESARVMLGLPVGEAVADRLQLLDQVVGLGGGDGAEELVDPGLVPGGEAGEGGDALRR